MHTISSVAQRYGISRNHLMKVAQTLIQADFVAGIRGRNGGLQLAKQPAEIRLGDVVRTTEDSFALVECFDSKHNECIITSACGLVRPLHEALSAFIAVLDRYTLADIMQSSGRNNRMRRLLDAAE